MIRSMLTLLVLMGMALPAHSAARIEFEQTTLDAGTLRPKSRHEYVFRFKNAGDETLVIRRVIKTCGCTSPTVTKRELAPGESGEVHVFFYTVGYWGPIRKHVVVESNDPAQPRVQLNLRARVEAAVQPASSELLVRDLVPGETRELELKVTSRLKEPLKLNMTPAVPADMSKHLSVTVRDQAQADGNHVLRFSVTAGPQAPAGRKITVPVAVQVVGHERESFDVKLKVAFQSLAEVNPASLFVYNADPNAARIASFVVTGTGPGTLRLENLGTNAPVRLKAVSEGENQVRVDVLPVPGARGRIQGIIRFKAMKGDRFLLMAVPIRGAYR